MLVLTRTVGTAIVIGDDMVVRVLSITNGDVKFEVVHREKPKSKYLETLVRAKKIIYERFYIFMVDQKKIDVSTKNFLMAIS